MRCELIVWDLSRREDAAYFGILDESKKNIGHMHTRRKIREYRTGFWPFRKVQRIEYDEYIVTITDTRFKNVDNLKPFESLFDVLWFVESLFDEIQRGW